jgi:hypothetical protein
VRQNDHPQLFRAGSVSREENAEASVPICDISEAINWSNIRCTNLYLKHTMPTRVIQYNSCQYFCPPLLIIEL